MRNLPLTSAFLSSKLPLLAARIVEVVSGMTFDVFLQKRLFDRLGMNHTTFI